MAIVLNTVFSTLSGFLTDVTLMIRSRLRHFGHWVGVVTTGTGAVTAHLAAARYDYNAIAYLGTANRLESLHDIWQADPDRLRPEIQARFVDECEQAISSQNESWLVEYTCKKNKSL